MKVSRLILVSLLLGCLSPCAVADQQAVCNAYCSKLCHKGQHLEGNGQCNFMSDGSTIITPGNSCPCVDDKVGKIDVLRGVLQLPTQAECNSKCASNCDKQGISLEAMRIAVNRKTQAGIL